MICDSQRRRLAACRNPHADGANVLVHEHHARRLSHHRHVGNTAVVHKVLGPATAAAIGGTLVVNNGVALDLSAYECEQHVPVELDTRFDDRFGGGEKGGTAPFHIVYAHAVDPAVFHHG